MRKNLFIALFFIALLGACGQPHKEVNKPTVIVSILPQKYFVERISDTLVQVEVMVPPGISPELYEPSPRQLMTFSEANIYFSLGLLTFEKTILKDISAQNPHVLTVNHSQSLNLITGDHHHGHGSHGHGHGYDPHVWTSPKEVKTIVSEIEQALSSQFPDYAPQFKANASAFLDDIQKLDEHIKATFDGHDGARFFIFHPALSYYARDCGLEQVAFEEEGKSPSAKYLRQVLEQANAQGIRTIFIQREFDINIAKTAAADIGGEVVVIDPLDPHWLNNMYSITQSIKDALPKKEMN